jgi:hypothetical protein
MEVIRQKRTDIIRRKPWQKGALIQPELSCKNFYISDVFSVGATPHETAQKQRIELLINGSGFCLLRLQLLESPKLGPIRVR